MTAEGGEVRSADVVTGKGNGGKIEGSERMRGDLVDLETSYVQLPVQ